MSAPTIVEVEGRKLKLTNLDKIPLPGCGFTRGRWWITTPHRSGVGAALADGRLP